MEHGKEAPRIEDPQLPDRFITKGWDRSHFETFMHRVREADKNAKKALAAKSEADQLEGWAKVFGGLWPTEAEAKSAASMEAKSIQPGSASVSGAGNVLSGIGIVSRPTSYHHDP